MMMETREKEMKAEVLKTVVHVAEHAPFYKKRFKDLGLVAKQIKTEDDFIKIPFTTKDDLAAHNHDFLCVPISEIKEYVTTSGTLGEPVSFYLTANDLERLANNEADSLRLAGATSIDVFQLMVTLDKLFMAGLAYYLGVRKIGAGIIRTGAGSRQSQISAMLKFKSTILVAVPSFIVKIIEYAKENGIDLASTPVKSIVCIGEPIRKADLSLNETGRRIKEQWDVQLFSTYASTEMAAAFTECEAGAGGHLNESLLHLEVVDELGNVVTDGELGEVVVTSIGVEGIPLLRYKTGDLCHVYYQTCSCGLKSPRLGPVIGRKQQMIKLKGTTLFPAAIFEVMIKAKMELYQVEVTKNELGNDEVTVLLPNDVDETDVLLLKERLREDLRVSPLIQMMDKKTLTGRVYNQHKRKVERIVFL